MHSSNILVKFANETTHADSLDTPRPLIPEPLSGPHYSLGTLPSHLVGIFSLAQHNLRRKQTSGTAQAPWFKTQSAGTSLQDIQTKFPPQVRHTTRILRSTGDLGPVGARHGGETRQRANYSCSTVSA